MRMTREEVTNAITNAEEESRKEEETRKAAEDAHNRAVAERVPDETRVVR